MKIRLLDSLLIIDLMIVLLIICILVLPSSALRVVLGIPAMLFFPGYVLVAALFPHNDSLPVLERLILSFGLSIITVALIGLGLNYTPWGIRLNPVLFSISAFVLVLSAVAMYRRWRLTGKSYLMSSHTLRLPGWEGSSLNKALSVVLLVSALSAAGVIVYAVAIPKVGEKFTESYILGLNGQAADYPTAFALKDGRVSQVIYGNGQTRSEKMGTITIGLVNHEQKPATYSVITKVDGSQVDVTYNGQTTREIGPVALAQGEQWEGIVGFAPEHTGVKQRVEFAVYRDGALSEQNSVHIWVDVN